MLVQSSDCNTSFPKIKKKKLVEPSQKISYKIVTKQQLYPLKIEKGSACFKKVYFSNNIILTGNILSLTCFNNQST